MARACGYEIGRGTYCASENKVVLVRKGGNWYVFDPCTDRNTLPEIWEAVENAGKQIDFCVEINTMWTMPRREWQTWEWDCFILSLPPRWHVEAALHALSLWPEDWSED